MTRLWLRIYFQRSWPPARITRAPVCSARRSTTSITRSDCGMRGPVGAPPGRGSSTSGKGVSTTGSTSRRYRTPRTLPAARCFFGHRPSGRSECSSRDFSCCSRRWSGARAPGWRVFAACSFRARGCGIVYPRHSETERGRYTSTFGSATVCFGPSCTCPFGSGWRCGWIPQGCCSRRGRWFTWLGMACEAGTPSGRRIGRWG